jgi:hypothetical protein
MPPLTFLLLLLPIAGVASSPAPAGCPNYACGNVAVRYPFWVGNDTGAHCGYTGFGLECRHGTPVLRLPSGEYGITSISYGSTPAISAFDIALLNATCPDVAGRSLHLLPGSPPPLSLTARNTNVSFLLNCTFTFRGVSRGHLIPCLLDRHNVTFSFYIPDGWLPPHEQARLCQEVVTMPVLGIGDDVLLALRAGFELTWAPAAGGPCRSCEQAGGFCGQRRGQFNCFTASKDEGACQSSFSQEICRRSIAQHTLILTTKESPLTTTCIIAQQ